LTEAVSTTLRQRLPMAAQPQHGVSKQSRVPLVASAMALVAALVIGVFKTQPQLVSRALWGSGLMQKTTRRYLHPPQGNPTGDDSSFWHFRSALSEEYYQDAIVGWEPRDTDVVTSTFPKSGTHLLTQMVLQVVGDGNVTFSNVHHAGALLFDWEVFGTDKCGDPDILSIVNYKDKRPTQPVVLGSHMPAPVLMRPGGQKYVVMMRDPLDIIISLHNQLSKVMPPWMLPSHEFVFEKFLKGFTYGYAGFYLRWWKEHEKHPDRVLFLFYEDVLADLTQALKTVSSFLGKDLTPETLERVRHRSSIEYMKPIADSFEPPACMEVLPDQKYNKGDMINKGVKGRGKHALSLELQEKARAYIEDTMAGSTFPVERYCGAP